MSIVFEAMRERERDRDRDRDRDRESGQKGVEKKRYKSLGGWGWGGVSFLSPGRKYY